MKGTLIVLGFVLLTTAASAQTGYATYGAGGYSPSGVYVAPGGYYRSRPDGTTLNNYSTQGNMNPYTGRVGPTPPSLWSGNGWGSGNHW
jgi:hypothetical protein